MRISKAVLVHGLIGAGVITGAAIAARPPAPGAAPAAAQPEMPQDMAAAMKAWQATMNPGAPHEHLARFVGEWDTRTSLYWDPNGAPMTSKGTASNTMILGGRFLKSEHTGQITMPAADGSMQPMDMNGIAITGYNNYRKQYTNIWLDNMNTAAMTSAGNLDPSGDVMTLFGHMDEPMTGEIGKTVKYTTRVVSDDEYIFEIHEVLYGEPFKVVEVRYTRR